MGRAAKTTARWKSHPDKSGRYIFSCASSWALLSLPVGARALMIRIPSPRSSVGDDQQPPQVRQPDRDVAMFAGGVAGVSGCGAEEVAFLARRVPENYPDFSTLR